MNKDLEFNMKITTNSNLDMKIDGSNPIDLDFEEYFKETDPIFKDSPAYTITEEDIIKWNDKSDFSGNYEDLTNKPFIPTKTSDLVNNSGFITKEVNDLAYYTLSTLLSNVATSGSYTDLSNTPTIPTTTEELINDSGFITNEVNDLTNYTLSSALATVATTGQYSDLIGNPTIPDSTSELYNDSGFITKDVNNLDNYTLSSSLATVATTGSYTDLTSTPTIPVVDSSVSTSSTNVVENQAITNYVDQIEEIGTSGGWIYRKWRNGISECYKNITPSGIAVNNAWGTGLYYGTVTGETFPTNLFIETPCINYTCIGGTSLICMNSTNASSTTTGDIQVARGTSNASAGCNISIYAIGKWK